MRVRTTILMLAASAVVATASSAQEQSQGPADDVIEALILHDAAPPAGAQLKAPGKPLLTQAINFAGDAFFELPPDQDKALRDRFGMEKRAPVFLAHLLRRDASGIPTHGGWLFCAINVRMFKGQALDCFRDADGDRRFESIAQFESHRPPPALVFSPIDPISYRLSMTADLAETPIDRYRGTLSIKYAVDAARGMLQFRAEAETNVIGLKDTYKLEPVVEVDPARLPAEVELAGARLRLLGWDGKKLSYIVERPMTGNPILLDPPGGGRKFSLGKIKGYTLRIVDASLPH